MFNLIDADPSGAHDRRVVVFADETETWEARQLLLRKERRRLGFQDHTSDDPAAPTALAAFDEVAQRLFDVLAQWNRRRNVGAPLDDLTDTQRRLRYALDAVPENVRLGLPRAREIAAADWQKYFRVRAAAEAEVDAAPAMASANESLAGEVARAKETAGRSVIVLLLGLDEPPREVMVSQ